jgi:hypothetical protein
VLPALNIEPSSFHLSPGFHARAERRARPTVLALNRMTDVLVYIGASPDGEIPEDGLDVKADDALATLPDASRAVCERLVIAWTDTSTQLAYAAAFAVIDGKAAGTRRLLAVSWSPPDTWAEPSFAPATAGEETLSRYLEHLAALIAQRSGEPDFDGSFDRVVTIIGQVLAGRGGESQDAAARPPLTRPDAEWLAWLRHYEQAIRDEWCRVTGARRTAGPAVVAPTSSGPLTGTRVFLSYPRREAASLALPVHEALCASGATVWFDQEQNLDAAWLNAGLAEAIATCDAFVMCASDEFIERAGYATQELAWALSHRSQSASLHVATVARPGSLLPTSIATWPHVELQGQSAAELGRQLSAALSSPAAIASRRPEFRPIRTPRPSLPADADLVTVDARVRHLRRFDEIPQDAVGALVAGKEIPGLRQVGALLRNCGDELGWSGRLDDMDEWPPDSIIRDLRLRLASARVVAGTRWPLSNDLDDTDDVRTGLEILARHIPPIMDWPAVPGWGDNERRFAMRYHAGAVRSLELLLSRGLYGGLSVSSEEEAVFERQLMLRRVECYDAIIDLRLGGGLSWKADPPTWDALFRSWRKFLAHPPTSWHASAPPSVRFLISGNADNIAAVAAQASWCAAHHGNSWKQRIELPSVTGPARISVFADATEEGDRPGPESDIRLGLKRAEAGSWVVLLSWPKPGEAEPGRQVSVCDAPPAELRQAMSFLSI